MKTFKDLNIKQKKYLSGEKVSIKSLIGKSLIITDSQVLEGAGWEKQDVAVVQFKILETETPRVFLTGSKNIIRIMKAVNESDFPFTTTIKQEGNNYILE